MVYRDTACKFQNKNGNKPQRAEAKAINKKIG